MMEARKSKHELVFGNLRFILKNHIDSNFIGCEWDTYLNDDLIGYGWQSIPDSINMIRETIERAKEWPQLSWFKRVIIYSNNLIIYLNR